MNSPTNCTHCKKESTPINPIVAWSKNLETRNLDEVICSNCWNSKKEFS